MNPTPRTVGLSLALALSLALPPVQPALAVQETIAPVQSDPLDTARVRLESVLNGGGDEKLIFTPEFLAAVPIAQVRQLFAQQIQQYGPFKGLTITERKGPTLAAVTASYERADAIMNLSVDANSGLIDGLRITEISAHDTSLASITKDVAALHGKAAFTVIRLDENGPAVLASHNADMPMAIGSAFKLYVLATIADEIAAHRLRWDQVVAVGTPSLPSGITQAWPRGSKATIETLAILMISISDNTATDTLIRLVGHEKIEKKMASLGHKHMEIAAPFLTTAEAFALKMPANQDLLTRWNALDSKGRAKLLKDEASRLSGTKLNPGQFTNIPRAIETVEWFASPNDIAAVLSALGNSRDPMVKAILAVNPGTTPARKGALSYIGFKGGSEPGVLSLNFLVQAKSGKNYAIAISWNDSAAAVDTATLLRLAERMIDNVAAD